VIYTDESIARLIAGDAPPFPLVFFIRKARDTLANTIKKEREYPYRNELLARLEKLDAAIETVRSGMRDFDMSTILLAGDGSFLNQNETYHGLGDLAERVKGRWATSPEARGGTSFLADPRARRRSGSVR
jgi:hypothetical protein